MSFEVPQKSGKVSVPADGIVLSTRARRRDNGKNLTMKMGADAASKIGVNEDKQKVEIAWGRDEDLGRLRVRKASHGATVSQHNDGTFAVNFVPASGFSQESYSNEPVDFELTDEGDGFFVELPDGFYKTEAEQQGEQQGDEA